ncbi:hypothetical protein BDP81DRAFT_68813 [Colletotrichum phormii]|uniref:Uncharacterized protein n=1 Tax=Colletotrichum phormii TaxID=359342 RepID=A0AAI9ZKE5_9PEZI|nr:uncharacterized protein BDP81DRAFT_68813 [Colletotrichum phormii]KAK1633616.1 hypothetical protein BDP81DRAFT_68813 [Colletotrichum phormii]
MRLDVTLPMSIGGPRLWFLSVPSGVLFLVLSVWVPAIQSHSAEWLVLPGRRSQARCSSLRWCSTIAPATGAYLAPSHLCILPSFHPGAPLSLN